MANQRPAYPLESVDRALRLITLLQGGETLTVTQAADALGVVPSTAHRLLGALCFRDYATQDTRRRYVAGPALVRAPQPITSASLRSAAAPGLHEIHEAFGETTHLMVLRGTHIQFLDGIEANHVLRVGLRIGGTMPAYCSAGGKSMLAALPPAEVDSLHRSGLPPWPTARINDVAALKRQLAKVRRLGYGINTEETEQGVCGVGTCITDGIGRPAAAFTLAIPASRFHADRVPTMAEVMRRASAETTTRLLQP